MYTAPFLVVISLLHLSHCNESDSTEINQIEISPFHDAIIFSDVLDVINELNKNLNSPLNSFENSESEENIEDLLSEYQHYLDKAHEQRRIYLQKFNKTKNKVPSIRHEKFIKTSLPNEEKYNKKYSHSPNTLMSQTAYNRPLDLFLPYNLPFRYINKPEHGFATQKYIKEEFIRNLNKLESEAMKPLNLSLLLSKSINKPIKSPCFYELDQIPCMCKQCVIPITSVMPSDKQFESDKKGLVQSPSIFEPKFSEYMLEDVNNKANTLNMRIKVDIQLPRMQDAKRIFEKIYKSGDELDGNSKEFASNIRLPSAYFNFPIPMDYSGIKILKSNKYDSSSMPKIMIQKKKKSRSGSNNKRHRKKLITFHNLNLSPSNTVKLALIEKSNTITEKNTYTNLTHHFNEVINTTLVKMAATNITSTELPVIVNTTETEENIYFMGNLSNETNGEPKTGNSIEFEYKTVSLNNTATKPNFRLKRDTILQNQIGNLTNSSIKVNSGHGKIKIKSNKQIFSKKSNRTTFSDTELLYWPSHTDNLTLPYVSNITEFILERENRKTKFNMTKEAIQQNRTMTWEQVIFSEVDWNNIEKVAPLFISFVGKYINGALTFCSEKICHSVKCTHKTCVYRICLPEDRFNSVGHCNGSTKTDSVASMESITDLPSKIAFEIVDLLQRKMKGKLFGKVTLCISSNCISFITSKKIFIKSKCVTKELNKTGHCPYIKKS